MKKYFGLTLGGVQKKTMLLVLMMLAVAAVVFGGLSYYQNRMLTRVVNEARAEQQQAISEVSQETMHQIMVNTLVQNTTLQANIADNDFSEIVRNVRMLASMAQGIFENRDGVRPATVGLPDPAMDGVPSAMALFEEGVDYTQSEDLALAANLSGPMIAMFRNSDKIDGCYIGLADGTDLCVDEKPLVKLDDAGDPIPFPVRERPWYTGAVEAGGVYFTGIEEDAFSGRLLVTCSAPVTANGELVGVVGIDIMLENMKDFVEAAGEGSSIFVVNEKGQVILSTAESGLFAAARADEAADLRELGVEELSRFVDAALKDSTGLNIILLNGRQYYAAGVPMPTIGWAVVTIVDKEITEQPEKLLLAEYDKTNAAAGEKFREGTVRTNRSSVLIFVLLVLLGACAALIGSKRIVKPLEQMTQNIVESGRTGKLFEMKDDYRTNDEIEVLAEAFDDLSKKTKRYIEDITEITREKERVNTELNMANQIQTSMLPHIFPAFPTRSEFDIYASMDPAKAVGGDFYDFFLIDEDHLCMVMADVSGKGVPAALFMMVSKAILKNNAMMGKSPAEILRRANETICSNNTMQMFVTVWLGILEISTGVVTCANAGHEYPALSQSGGPFALLKDSHGFVIGGMEGVRYKEYELRLSPGDRLFVYTDGVPEATDDQGGMFGTQRMLDALNAERDARPEEILRNVRGAVDGFVNDAEQFDDLTMLCLEYTGPAQRGTDAKKA